MREIEFRAWDNKREVLVTQDNVEDQVEFDDDGGGYGPYYGDEWFPAKKILSIFDYFQEIARDDRFIVEQFTGLLDKNGTKIFEGDIVKWGHLANSTEKPIRIAVVEFSPDIRYRILNFVDKWKCPVFFQQGCFAYAQTHLYLEVIGNIHDNPELLEVEE